MATIQKQTMIRPLMWIFTILMFIGLILTWKAIKDRTGKMAGWYMLLVGMIASIITGVSNGKESFSSLYV